MAETHATHKDQKDAVLGTGVSMIFPLTSLACLLQKQTGPGGEGVIVE